MYDILIRSTTVLPMTKPGGAVEAHDIAINGQRIAAVAPAGTLAADAARIIDGAGHFVMPGMVNMHTHMGQTFHRGTAEAMLLKEWLDQDAPIINSMTADDVYWAAALACCEMLHAGVTVFADMFFHEDRVAQAAVDTGMRAQIGQGIMEQLGGEDLGRGAASEQIARSVATAEEWHGKANGRITARLSPHAIYTLSPATLRATLAEAKSKGYGIHTHLSETIPELEWCQATYGMSPPQWFAENGFLEVPIIFAHCVHLSDEDIEILDVDGVGIAHNPGSNLKLGSGRARIPDLTARKHLAVGLGSDSTGSNDSLDLLKEAYLAAIIHDWPIGSKPARTCLEMATREGARALGLDGEIGTVEVGKKADLAMFKLGSARMTPLHDLERTLIYAGRASDVSTVIVDGQIVLDDGMLTQIDEERVLREARERTARLFKW